MLDAFLLTAPVIFVAELGDKSALATFSFATRYRPWQVLGAVALANAITQGVSVGAGMLAGEMMAGRTAGVLAGLLFLVFAALSLRRDTPDDLGDDAGDDRRGPAATGGLLATIVVAVVVAEFGDKTMFATMALAAQLSAFGVWLGSVVGMTAISALAVLAGRFLRTRVPHAAIRIGAALLFAGVGVILLIDALL